MNNTIHNKKIYKQRRQELRNNATDAEQLLWQKLKASQLGFKFRRQHGIGNYIVDFYCPSLKLIIELDGSQHHEVDAITYDKIRTEYLNSLNISVVRYNNYDVLTNIDAVVMDIVKQIEKINTKEN